MRKGGVYIKDIAAFFKVHYTTVQIMLSRNEAYPKPGTYAIMDMETGEFVTHKTTSKGYKKNWKKPTIERLDLDGTRLNQGKSYKAYLKEEKGKVREVKREARHFKV